MTFVENWKDAVDIVLHPVRSTSMKMTIKESLKFYFSIMIIPMILGIILSIIIQIWYVSLVVVLYFLLIFPISILVNAGIYHIIIGRIFRFYKGNYTRVVNAFTFSLVPTVFIYWIVIPLVFNSNFMIFKLGASATTTSVLVGFVLITIIEVWSFIIMLFALSNQLSISKLKSFGTLILEGVIVFLAVVAVSMIITAIPSI